MSTRRKIFLLLMITLTLSTSCAMIFSAARNAGAFWSSFDSYDGANAGIPTGYVVIDAMDSRHGIMEGIGPFLAHEPSFNDSDLVFYEDGAIKDPAISDDVQEQYWKEIKISAGDTLSKIAEDNGISVKDIMTANELTDQHKLKEGQILYIPDSHEHVLDTLDFVKNRRNDEINKKKQAKPLKLTNYIVKDGDTLWSIANAFDIDINSLFGCNKLSDANKLKVGTSIRIPNQDGVMVTVKPGVTIDKLAKEYSTYPEAIMSANGLTSGSLVANSEIFLPGAKVSAFIETNGAKMPVSQAKTKAESGFGWPVIGKISSSYGWRKDPIRRGKDFHTGLDIRAPRGRNILASMSGKVVHSGWMGGYGKTIVLQHSNGLTTLYAHCSQLLVKKGANVKKGQRIALVGSTGRSTGNHLHFEIRKNGTTLSPLKYLR